MAVEAEFKTPKTHKTAYPRYWMATADEKIWARQPVCVTQEHKQCYEEEKWARFYQHGLTLIRAWISNDMPIEMLNGITYFQLNDCTL